MWSTRFYTPYQVISYVVVVVVVVAAAAAAAVVVVVVVGTGLFGL